MLKSVKINSPDIPAYCLLAGIFIVRFWYSGSMDLAPDEAYYWDWSRQIGFGYFDHPPMIAWILYLSTHLFGDTLRGVKFLIVGASFLATLFSYFLAKKYVRQTSSLLLFVIVSNTVILYGIGGLIATPDVPQVLFWSIGLVCAYTAIFENSRTSWVCLGLTIGLGLLSKYIFVLFIISLLLFLMWHKGLRYFLRTRAIYGTLALSFLIFLPNILWNSRHKWVTIFFQFRHGMGSASYTHFDYLGEYLSGQLAVLSIFPFVFIFWAIISEFTSLKKDPKKAFLAIFFIVPFAFFALTSLQKRVEANWAAPAYVSALIWIPILWEKLGSRKKNVLRFCIAVSTAISCVALILIMVHIQKPFLPLTPGMDPTSQAHGWQQWATDISTLQKKHDPGQKLPLFTNRYQEAALAGLYMPNHPHAISLNINSRENNYSLMYTDKNFPHKNGLFVYCTADTFLAPEIQTYFSTVTYVGRITRSFNHRILDTYGIFNVVIQ